MRRNLAIVFVITLMLVVAASIAIISKHAGSDVSDVYDAAAIQSQLTRIGTWLTDQAPAAVQQLQPPIGREQISALAKSRGVTVPEEVYSLYAWHNGASADITKVSLWRIPIPPGG